MSSSFNIVISKIDFFIKNQKMNELLMTNISLIHTTKIASHSFFKNNKKYAYYLDLMNQVHQIDAARIILFEGMKEFNTKAAYETWKGLHHSETEITDINNSITEFNSVCSRIVAAVTVIHSSSLSQRTASLRDLDEALKCAEELIFDVCGFWNHRYPNLTTGIFYKLTDTKQKKLPFLYKIYRSFK